MMILNEFVEILFYLGITLIIEMLVLLGLGYFNKKIIFTLLLVNFITNPVYSLLLAIYSHLFNSEMGIGLVLILEIIVIYTEFYILYKYLKNKYSKIEIMLMTLFVNGFSFLLVEFIRYVFLYYPIFPVFS